MSLELKVHYPERREGLAQPHLGAAGHGRDESLFAFAIFLNRTQHLERPEWGLSLDGLEKLDDFATGSGTHQAVVLSTNDEASMTLEQR